MVNDDPQEITQFQTWEKVAKISIYFIIHFSNFFFFFFLLVRPTVWNLKQKINSVT